MTHFRWVILVVVFVGTTLNYLDRSIMGVLATPLQEQYGISDVQYGYIQSAFAFSYALAQTISGGLLDRFGARLVYAVALASWSVSAMLHALARGAWGFGLARALLGVSESPNFPAATKIIAEWFPQRERALAFGFVNAGTNMGAIVAPAVVPVLASTFGWQWAFIGLGAIGLVWLCVWIPVYRSPQEHPAVSVEELALIQSDPPEPTVKVPWLNLLGYRQAWAFGVAKFLTDSMWWFYITWLPKFLHKQYGLDLLHIGAPLVTIYFMSDMGSISGGWISSSLIKRGASVNRARKTALLICAVCVLPILFAEQASSQWIAVLILGLATAAHQGFSSNLFTLVSDMFPRRAVGSVAGFGGMCGYVGAALFQIIVGYSVERQHNYFVPFLCASMAYIVAVICIQLLVPRVEPAFVDNAPNDLKSITT
jgi:MFS transporter, ACS family, hexuronate transporter